MVFILSVYIHKVEQSSISFREKKIAIKPRATQIAFENDIYVELDWHGLLFRILVSYNHFKTF